MTILLLLYIMAIIIAILKKKYVIVGEWVGGLLIIALLKELNIYLKISFELLLMPLIGFIGYIVLCVVTNKKYDKSYVICFVEMKKHKIKFLKSLNILYSATYKELLWRGLVVYFDFQIVSVIIVNLVFTLLHISKKSRLLEYIYLFMWSISLTTMLHYTKSIFDCIIIHFTQNMCVCVYKKYLAQGEK